MAPAAFFPPSPRPSGCPVRLPVPTDATLKFTPSQAVWPKAVLPWGGAVDVVGDVHGCFSELCRLCGLLGYAFDRSRGFSHPQGRFLVFVGDLVDRGPHVDRVVAAVRATVMAGRAACALGNHDDRLRRFLLGHQVGQKHGLPESVSALRAEDAWIGGEKTLEFLESLPVLMQFCRPNAEGTLPGEGAADFDTSVCLRVSHAGWVPRLEEASPKAARKFCIYGDVDGHSTDAYGFPLRRDWESSYSGNAPIIYGHTPLRCPAWQGKTLNLDSGCVFGGSLSAWSWPENQITSVPAQKAYAQHGRPW